MNIAELKLFKDIYVTDYKTPKYPAKHFAEKSSLHIRFLNRKWQHTTNKHLRKLQEIQLVWVKNEIWQVKF